MEDNFWGVLLGTVICGGLWFFGYRKGRLDVIKEIEGECMKIDIEELRAKLAEQNRINEMNRMKI